MGGKCDFWTEIQLVWTAGALAIVLVFVAGSLHPKRCRIKLVLEIHLFCGSL